MATTDPNKKKQKKTKPKAPVGRPPSFTPALAEKVCIALSSGKTLISICKPDNMPSYTTVMKWRAENDEFAEMYAQARVDSADHDADEIRDIADDTTLTFEDRRIRIDARKWAAGKRNARHYGDSKHIEHTGPNRGPIQSITDVNVMNEKQLDEELERLRAEAAKTSDG